MSLPYVKVFTMKPNAKLRTLEEVRQGTPRPMTTKEQLNLLNNALRLNGWTCSSPGIWYSPIDHEGVSVALTTGYTMGELDIKILTNRLVHGDAVAWSYRGGYGLREFQEAAKILPYEVVKKLSHTLDILVGHA